MKRPLEPRTIAACFGAAVAVLAWISLASFWSMQRLTRSFDTVTQTHRVLDKLQHLDLLMESAESSVRGYIITGETGRLAPYRYAVLVIPYEIKQLDGLFAFDPRSRTEWDKLSGLLSRHLSYLSETVALQKSRGAAAASQRMKNQDNAAKRNAMAQLLSAMQAEERTQLNLLRLHIADHALNTTFVLIGATLASLGLLAWAFRLLSRVAHERRQAESAGQRSETFLDSIVERIPYMILVKEAIHLRFTLVNTAAEEGLGRSRKELLGSNEFDLRPRPEAEAAVEKDRAALREKTVTDILEERLALPGKEERVLHTQKISMPDDRGNPAYLLTISEDITQRKQAERMLELSRDAAVESARLRSEFIRNMSHEFRTPLSVVSGMTTLLLNTGLTEEQRRFATMVQHAADGLSQLSKEILDFSKIEAGAFSIEVHDIDIRQVIDEVLGMLGGQAKTRGVTLSPQIAPEVPPLVRGDAVRLRQVLTHLIGNAVKFTERGDVGVAVTEERQSETQTWMHVRITDTGPGIPDDVQKHLFEAFRQGDGSRTRRYGGTGLGLAISKRILELMGGTIGFDSTPGRGSIFWFTVPFQKPSAEGDSVQGTPLSAQNRVLVIDESETGRQMLHEQLRALAFSVQAVSSGQTALALLRREAKAGRPYPLVVLDMHLPDMDGIIFARLVKNDAALAATRLIVLTSAGASLDASAATAFGFSACIAKPLKPEDLLERLASLFKP